MNSKIIYADGSSLGNPGRGGWAYLVIDQEVGATWEGGGAENVATNNQMELKAMLESLKFLKSSKRVGQVEYRLDSQYVIKGITEWSSGWVKNGWRTAAKKPVLNDSLWKEILQEMKEVKDLGFKITFNHVYGHTGEEYNERVDTIARTLAGGGKIDLRNGTII